MKKDLKFYLFLLLALLWGALFYLIIIWGLRWVNNAYLHYKYPLKYEVQIVKYSSEFMLYPSLVSAVIYEESRFRPDSRSDKGAIGLMQLLPDTADYIAKRLVDDDYSREKISSVDQNIRYGCYYLFYLYRMYGDWERALAAYNAGEGNVSQWIAEGDYEVKFEETKNFVERVKKTQGVYKKLYFGD